MGVVVRRVVRIRVARWWRSASVTRQVVQPARAILPVHAQDVAIHTAVVVSSSIGAVLFWGRPSGSDVCTR